MEIKIVSEDELVFIPAICMDPSVGKGLKKVMKNCMEQRISWIKKMMRFGLEILVALDTPKNEIIYYKWAGKMRHSDLAIKGYVPMGLIESIPIEFALEPLEGKDSLFINCIWILPAFWNKGVGKALIKRLIERAKKVGGISVLAYDNENWFGTTIKYMPSQFFQKFGFKEVDREDERVLLYLDLGSKAAPSLIKYQKLNSISGLNLFLNSQCPWNCFMVDDIKRNLKNYPNINLNLINTDNKEIIKKYGISRGVIMNDKPLIKRMASWSEIKNQFERILKSNKLSG
ncbi:MAG: GNAT family N-acetyltransferase [Candidatus Heimdallarchaeota archaeon]